MAYTYITIIFLIALIVVLVPFGYMWWREVTKDPNKNTGSSIGMRDKRVLTVFTIALVGLIILNAVRVFIVHQHRKALKETTSIHKEK